MPTEFDSEVDTAAGRDDPNYWGDQQPVFSARGPQPLALENGKPLRMENDEYLLGEASWPGTFESKVSTSSSRD